MKSWLKAQHSENEDHGIRSHHFMGNKWGNSGNSVRLYFVGLQNHCTLYLCACVLSHVWLFATLWTVCSPPGSSVHGIFQARILEWAAISYSRLFLTSLKFLPRITSRKSVLWALWVLAVPVLPVFTPPMGQPLAPAYPYPAECSLTEARTPYLSLLYPGSWHSLWP